MDKASIIKKLINEKDIKPEEYDGSYKLVQTAVDLYKNIDLTEVDYHDLELIYFLTIGTWSSSYSKKKKLVRKSNLLDKDKDKLVNLIDEIKVKAESGGFNNLSKENETGMFGTGFHSFKKGDSFPEKDKVKIFIEYLVKINNAEDENKAIEILADMLPIDITNFGVASLSQILHCLKPHFFPVINSLSREVYNSLNLNLEKPNDINNYYKNLMKIKNFRDENFKFKNYRVIDHLTIENYLDNDWNSNKLMVSPYDKIFFSISKAIKTFDFMSKIAAKLGIENKNNEVYSLNYRDYGTKKGIHFDYADILVFGVYGFTNKDSNYCKIALFKKEGKEHSEEYAEKFNSIKGSKKVSLFDVKFEDLIEKDGELSKLFFETLDYIKNQKSNYSRSPYRKFHQNNFAEAVFEKEKRKEILTDQVTLFPIGPVIFDINLDIQTLHFPQQMKNNLTKRIETNLRQGKHIILTGPPGTGKSKLAKEIAERYVDQNYEMVTATSDWSTFDTIGGYRPDKNSNLEFSAGIFLDCFKNNHSQQSKWLLIDEINRADIDKAFGPLFSALTGDSITLSFKDNYDNYIKVVPEKENDKMNITDNIYQINNDWRIIATMNTFDKTSLYEMSYAFMRRFAFIPVSIPQKIDQDLINNYLECWGIEEDDYTSEVIELWQQINNVRKIGPAIIEDIYKYLLENEDDYISALISYVMPQFEGIRSKELNSFKTNIKQLDFIYDDDFELLENFIKDYFQLGGI
jgi:MoxR-like ATPase